MEEFVCLGFVFFGLFLLYNMDVHMSTVFL